MKNLIKSLPMPLMMVLASFSVNSQTTNLTDYVITRYYAKSATATFSIQH